jgi:RNA 2',3'-cyclic 3'-phosphodiesterase
VSESTDASSPAERLFVAVWPPARVLAALGRLERPSCAGVRWTSAEQWHVTLRFLGSVDASAAAAAVAALEGLRGCPGARAVLGPAVVLLGREVLAVPVEGLVDLASAVDDAFTGIGRPTERRSFRGHITLARGKNVRPGLVAGGVEAISWPVDSVTLVRSHLGRRGARYEAVASAELVPP